MAGMLILKALVTPCFTCNRYTYLISSSRRKRHLSDCDPEMCEFMPLSKRINNLHIDGTQLSMETPSLTVKTKNTAEKQIH